MNIFILSLLLYILCRFLITNNQLINDDVIVWMNHLSVETMVKTSFWALDKLVTQSAAYILYFSYKSYEVTSWLSSRPGTSGSVVRFWVPPGHRKCGSVPKCCSLSTPHHHNSYSVLDNRSSITQHKVAVVYPPLSNYLDTFDAVVRTASGGLNLNKWQCVNVRLW